MTWFGQAEKKHREVKVGPHDCYCEVGFNCWQSKYLKPPAHGLQGTFEREFFTNTPGELALVWQLGENDKERLKQRMRKNEEAMAKLEAVQLRPRALPLRPRIAMEARQRSRFSRKQRV